MQPSDEVRASCEFVVRHSQNVTVDYDRIDAVAKALRIGGPGEGEENEAQIVSGNLSTLSLKPSSWHAHFHYFDGTPLSILYILVMDAVNFCFWPDPRWEYEDFAGRLKRTFENHPECVQPTALAIATHEDVIFMFGGDEPPLISARTIAVRQIGQGLVDRYGGAPEALVLAAGGCAQKLISLVVDAFPLFNDTAVFTYTRAVTASATVATPEASSADARANTTAAATNLPSWGRTAPIMRNPAAPFTGAVTVGGDLKAYTDVDVVPVRLSKRAQIVVADLWGAFGGRGYGAFANIATITTFADYRVPQTLRHIGAVRFSEQLTTKVAAGTLIPAGSAEEVEIRAATVVAVSALTAAIARHREADVAAALAEAAAAVASGTVADGPATIPGLCDIVVDWWLWRNGEAARDAIPPFHRTLTTNY